MIHVVIPAAGNGSRFVEAGYPPKPHVLVDGVPMLRRVVENVRPTAPNFVTVVTMEGFAPPYVGGDVGFRFLKDATSGAVETILQAGLTVTGESFEDGWALHGDPPLLIANCDQLLGFPVDKLIQDDVAGVIATFTSDSPAHSYVQLDEHGIVVDVAEKKVISDQAVAGVYYFRRARPFHMAAQSVIAHERLVLGEYYVSTVLAEMIERGYPMRTVHGDVHTLGTPQELEAYHARGRQ